MTQEFISNEDRALLKRHVLGIILNEQYRKWKLSLFSIIDGVKLRFDSPPRDRPFGSFEETSLILDHVLDSLISEIRAKHPNSVYKSFGLRFFEIPWGGLSIY